MVARVARADSQDAVGFLRRLGLRATQQRLTVTAVLRSAAPEHLTADEVWRRASRSNPTLNRSTVYRCLDDLGQAGAVVAHNLMGSAVCYELGATGHHHLVCRACGQVEDLPNDDIAVLVGRVRRRLGFQLGAGGLTLHGLCAACAGGSAAT